jgi:transposase-like protein
MPKSTPNNNLVDLSSLSPEQMEEILAGYMASKAKTADDFFGKGGLLSKMFGKSIETMLQAELKDHLGHAKYEKSDEDTPKTNYRNGTSEKTINTSAGSETIKVPRDRNGSFEPKIMTKYQKSTGELENKIIAMYARGLSTRDIADSLMDMYGIDVSADFISNVTEQVSELAQDWQLRPLDPTYAFVFFDAIHLKIRMEGKVETRAVYTCLGVNLEGYKDVLGIWVSPAKESANFWLSVMSEIQQRGVTDILIVSIDGLKGLRDAVLAIFPNAIVQRCIVHLIRNSLKFISWKDRKEFVSNLKPIYNAINENEAISELEKLREKWGHKYMLAVKVWETNWNELNPFFDFPQAIRKVMYTTNSVESYHRVLRKTTKTKSVFPSDTATLKCLYLATENVKRKWVMQIANWNLVLNQLVIKFGERING